MLMGLLINGAIMAGLYAYAGPWALVWVLVVFLRRRLMRLMLGAAVLALLIYGKEAPAPSASAERSPAYPIDSSQSSARLS